MLLIFGVQYWNFGRKYLVPVKAKTLPVAAGRVSGCLFRGIVSGLRLPWGDPWDLRHGRPKMFWARKTS
jgi:hypothetical protein